MRGRVVGDFSRCPGPDVGFEVLESLLHAFELVAQVEDLHGEFRDQRVELRRPVLGETNGLFERGDSAIGV